jgi:hypothetical protein
VFLPIFCWKHWASRRRRTNPEAMMNPTITPEYLSRSAVVYVCLGGGEH